MASSLSSFFPVTLPSVKWRSTQLSLQIRAQAGRDEGKSHRLVDANLSILRERIEEVRVKERLVRCCRSGNGWNYSPYYDNKHKGSKGSSQFFELFGLCIGTVGLTIVSSTLCLCFVSFVLHLNQSM